MRGFPIFGALVVAAISVFASPIQSGEVVQSAVGNVVDAQGKVYELQNTGTPNIRVITDKINGEFVRPVSFNVASMYTCKFYSESTRGVGSPIGEYKGPYSGQFGANWAAFYECWASAVSKTETTRDEMISCGYATTSSGTKLTMNEGKGLHPSELAINGEQQTPTSYHVADHCNCDFFGPNSRSGYVAIVKAAGPKDGDFGDKKVWGYICQNHA